MVTVGCKLPNGLMLEVGPKQVQVAGWRNNAVKIVGGYGLTQVEKAFWEAWLAEHGQQPYVKTALFLRRIRRTALPRRLRSRKP